MGNELGWYFTDDTLKHEGELEPCRGGYHASKHPLNVLRDAPGPILHRVRLTGDIKYDDGKMVASEWTILETHDVTDLLWQFTRRRMLRVLQLWGCTPDAVYKHLETEDEAQIGAREAAIDAVRAASKVSATTRLVGAPQWDAARNAIWGVVWDVSFGHVDSAWSASHAYAEAARAAGGDDAYVAAWSDARDAFAELIEGKFGND